MRFSDLKGKTKEELKDMLAFRQQSLFYGYKLINEGTPEGDVSDQMKFIEQEIDIIERKLK